MNHNFVPVLGKVEEEEDMEWGQFVDLDEAIPKQKKYKKRIIETYPIEEECETKEKENNPQTQENPERQTIFTISIPFTRKKMRIHLEKPKLFSYFSFTILSITAFIFIYKPYNSDNC